MTTTRKGTRSSERIKSKQGSSPSSGCTSSERPDMALGESPKKKTKGAPKDRTEQPELGQKSSSSTKLEGEAISGNEVEQVEQIDLSPMLTMPLDVFQEVLSHLHPRDLILVSRVSRRFREHLLLKNSTIWRRSRERIGAPDCPTHLSESAWAALLFLPRCQICGEPDVQIVDFFIQRRLCSSCRNKKLIDQIRFKSLEAYSLYSDDILDLVPYTDRHVHFRSDLSKIYPRYYLIEDIEQVTSKLESYKAIATNDEHRTKLDIYKDDQKAKIRTIHKVNMSKF